MDGTGLPHFDRPGSQTPIACIVCFSHLRWDHVFQRPHQLMTRLAQSVPVLFVEEAIVVDGPLAPELEVRQAVAPGIDVLVPLLPRGLETAEGAAGLIADLVAAHVARTHPGPVVSWHYSPMLQAWSRELPSAAVVYDCMDELSAFRFAPAALLDNESMLLARADVVFTGGYSLYLSKRDRHDNVHAMPSSVDRAHFGRARGTLKEPADQAGIPRPRLGFFGVLDERIDYELIGRLAAARPEWNIVLVGPTAKIDPREIPRLPNIHVLGPKPYAQLPDYLAGWDVALMPFALNEATRFISPTKTPEYLAGGRAVVSTPIADVVRHWHGLAGVRIAPAADFTAACDAAMALRPEAWRPAVDRILDAMSWDDTAAAMWEHVAAVAKLPRAGALPTPALGAVEPPFDYLIVGAGFAGAVLAERLARGANARVMVCDKRPHVAGNAHDHLDDDGVLVHRYGPHIFHTNSDAVFEYLSRFTAWRPYEHRVLAETDGLRVPMPINRTTLNMLFGAGLSDESAVAAFLAQRAESRNQILTSEDAVVAQIGRELYEKFFAGYTRKQWGLDASQLDKAVAARVPARCSDDDRYFQDRHQAMPLHGYTRMFETMLDHPNITVATGADWTPARRDVRYRHLIYTGPIDGFFGHRFGKLPYRSLTFRNATMDQAQVLPVGVVNFPSPTVPWTRVTEYKHLTGQIHAKTSLTFELPSAEGEPYYPVPRPENQALFKRYEALADALPDTTFVGRLASYRYYNMDQVVAQSLATFRRLVTPQVEVAGE